MNTTHIVLVLLAVIVLILVGMVIYNLVRVHNNKAIETTIKTGYQKKFPAQPSS